MVDAWGGPGRRHRGMGGFHIPGTFLELHEGRLLVSIHGPMHTHYGHTTHATQFTVLIDPS